MLARRRLLLVGGLAAAGLSMATFAPGTAPTTWAAALLLAFLAVVGGLLAPEGTTLSLAAAAPFLTAVPRLLGDLSEPPFLLAVACAALGAIAAKNAAEPSPLPLPLQKWAGLFLVAAGASALSSVLRGDTLFLLLRGGASPLFLNGLGMSAVDRAREAVRAFLVLALLLAALDAFTRVSRTRRRALLLAATGGALVAFFVSVLEARLRLPLTDPAWHVFARRAGTFTDPNALGVGAALLVPILLTVALGREHGLRARLAAAAALVLAPFVLQGSGSRSGLLLLGVAGLLAGGGLLRGRMSGRLALGLAAAFVAVVVLAAQRFAPRSSSAAAGGLVERIGASLSAGSLVELSSYRTFFWRAAFDTMGEEPLSGCGLGGFRFEFPVRWQKRHGQPVAFTDNATNALLDVGAECGVPALLLALAAAVPLLVRSLDAALAPASLGLPAGARAGGAAVVGFAVASLTGSHERFPEVALLLALAASFLPEPLPEQPAASGYTPPERLPWLLVGSSVLASLVVLVPTLRAESAFRTGPWVGVYGWERAGAGYHRWLGPRAFRRVLPGENKIQISLTNRRPDGRPVLAVADIDGGGPTSLTVPGGGNRVLTLEPIPAGATAVRLHFTPTFVPGRLGERRDERELSLQLPWSSEEPLP